MPLYTVQSVTVLIHSAEYGRLEDDFGFASAESENEGLRSNKT